jgi:hypothetical protein
MYQHVSKFLPTARRIMQVSDWEHSSALLYNRGGKLWLKCFVSDRCTNAFTSLVSELSCFMRLLQFAEGKVPRPEDRVVYMCGGFDLFNAGHISALQVRAPETGACAVALPGL